MRIGIAISGLSLFLVFTSAAFAQVCAPQIVANAKSENFFTPEQEMILGELTVQRLSTEFRPLRSPQLLAYVETIGNKLVKHLPETGLKYTFHIIDYPEANAFNIPGGHVFLTRKLIAFSNSEDELAGVIAHELGHAAVHHGAQDMSMAMRKILNISSLGDRKDVAEKYNLLIENARTKRVSSRSGHENEQQLEADKIGFYAMVGAGYDPNASFTFFDRLTESEGKTGSWFSDIFGNTRPAEKRLREIAKSTEQLPSSCRDGRSAKPTEDFLRWQADIVRFRESGRAENVPGLIWKRELEPKLRSDVQKIKFSTDGKLVLAADDFALTLIERETAKVLRQIPADDVSNVFFTANNTQVVFTNENLRFERWDLKSGNALEVRELVLLRDCWEHELSPDGNYLACVDLATNVNIIETKTGKKVWEKKAFYPLSFFEYITWLQRQESDSQNAVSFFRIGFTPDSKHVLFSRSNKYRFRFRIDGMTVDESENSALAIDLTTLKPIDLGGDVKKIASRPYVFLDSGRILGNTAAKLDSGGVFSFPNGKRLQKLEFGAESVDATATPDLVTIAPLANAKIGLYDVNRGAIVAAMDKNDVDVWGEVMAFESVSGKMVIRAAKYDEGKKQLDGGEVAAIDIPVGAVTDMRTAEVSDDFGWAALSSKSRGGVWNLKTGQRSIFTRGFVSGVVDHVGNSVANFPKYQQDSNSLAFLNSGTGQASLVKELPERGARQYGRFLLSRTSLKGKDDDAGRSPVQLTEEEKAEMRLRSDVKFEIKNWMADKVMWSRDFKGAAPRYSFDSFSGRLILFWRLASEEGKIRLKEDAALKAKADQMGNKEGDILVDVIDSFTGNSAGSILLETGRGSFGVSEGLSEREWLVLKDSEGRLLVYSLKDGSLRHRFFGKHAALNPKANQLIIENFPGEASLYNLDSAEKIADFQVPGSIAFARFSLDGSRLFLFSDGQTSYAIDLTKVKPAPRPVIF